MSNNVEISKIVIKIGEREIPLTIAEIVELRKVLDTTLKNNTWKLDPIPVPIPMPIFPPII